MRTKWLARNAAFLAAMFIASMAIQACSVDQLVNVDIPDNDGTVIGDTTITEGNCVTTYELVVDGLVVGGALTIQVNEIRNLRVRTRSNPEGCSIERTFRWESDDPSRVTVVEVDPVTGRIRGIAPGSATICGIAKEDSNIRICALVTVDGPGGGNVTIPQSGQTVSSCPSATRTLQLTTNPSVTGGTWEVSGLSGASVNSTGLLSWPENSSGAINVVRKDANGVVVASGTINVSNTGCGANVCAVTGLTATAGDLSLNINETSQITATQTTNGVAGCAGPTYSSSNNAVVTVNANGLVSAVGAGTAVVTVTAGDGSRSVQLTFTVNAQAPAPSGIISPSSLCFSMQAGQALTLPVVVTLNNANLADARLTMVMGNGSNGQSFTVSGSGANWNITRVGTFTERMDGHLDLSLATNPGVVISTIPVQVYTTLCPGLGSTIDYSPPGGTVTGTTTLTATCIQGSGDPACNPYWTSSDPSRIRVEGTGSVNVGGVTYRVGTTATLTRVAAGTAEICVQWSLTQTSPKRCYTWVAP